jgi:uncharacterized membrane protein YdjX (TVP38/TMEM64 family)
VDTPRSNWLGIALTAGAVAVGAVLVLLIPQLRDALGHAVGGDTEALRRDLGGIEGVILIQALIIIHAVVFFPAEIVNLSAGLVYGFGVAFPLVLAGWVVSGLVAYWIGRVAARPLLFRLVGQHRFEAAERLIERGGAPALLVARLIPVMPYSLVGYVAGACRVPVGRYAWTSAVGSAPLTAAVVLLGHRLDHLSADDPVVWATAGLIVVLFASALVVRRRLAGSSRESKRDALHR